MILLVSCLIIEVMYFSLCVIIGLEVIQRVLIRHGEALQNLEAGKDEVQIELAKGFQEVKAQLDTIRKELHHVTGSEYSDCMMLGPIALSNLASEVTKISLSLML